MVKNYFVYIHLTQYKTQGMQWLTDSIRDVHQAQQQSKYKCFLAYDNVLRCDGCLLRQPVGGNDFPFGVYLGDCFAQVSICLRE